MALKKTPKPAAEPAEIALTRLHPSNPIRVTQEDVLEDPTRIQIRAPWPIVIRGQASNRLDLGAILTLPENTTARVEPIQPHAHTNGYSLSSPLMVSGDEVTVFFRNHSMRTVHFAEGDVVGILTFQRHRAMVAEIDVALPEVPEKVLISRAGKVPEGELPFET